MAIRKSPASPSTLTTSALFRISMFGCSPTSDSLGGGGEVAEHDDVGDHPVPQLPGEPRGRDVTQPLLGCGALHQVRIDYELGALGDCRTVLGERFLGP